MVGGAECGGPQLLGDFRSEPESAHKLAGGGHGCGQSCRCGSQVHVGAGPADLK